MLLFAAVRGSLLAQSGQSLYRNSLSAFGQERDMTFAATISPPHSGGALHFALKSAVASSRVAA